MSAARNWKSVLRVAAGILVAVALLLSLLRAVGPLEEFQRALASVRVGWLGLAVTTALANLHLGALRLRWSLSIQGDDVRFLRCLRAVLTAWPLSAVLPSRSGDFFRAAYLRPAVPVGRALSSMVAEKLVDAVVLLAVASAGACLGGYPLLAACIASITLVAGLAVVVPGWTRAVVRLPGGAWLRSKARPLFAATRLLTARPGLLARLLLSSLGVLAISSLHLVLLCRAAGAEVPWTSMVAYLPLAMIAGGLPVTPAGLGTRDAALLALVESSFRSAELVLGTLLYGLTPFFYGLLGLPLLVRAGLPRRQRTAESSEA